MRLLVDTNVLVDSLANRQPYAEKASLLLIAGKVGEFELWVSSSQVTDLLYILSNGGRKSLLPQVTAAVDGLLDIVNVFAPGKSELRLALQSTWDDPEDALLHVIAEKLKAKAIITRNGDDFVESLIPVRSAEEYFAELEAQGVTYDLVET